MSRGRLAHARVAQITTFVLPCGMLLLLFLVADMKQRSTAFLVSACGGHRVGWLDPAGCRIAMSVGDV